MRTWRHQNLDARLYFKCYPIGYDNVTVEVIWRFGRSQLNRSQIRRLVVGNQVIGANVFLSA